MILNSCKLHFSDLWSIHAFSDMVSAQWTLMESIWFNVGVKSVLYIYDEFQIWLIKSIGHFPG
jgi:hypothetical protein